MFNYRELLGQCRQKGVRYVELRSICDIGKGVQFNKSDMNDRGSYPVINGGINPSGYIEKYNQKKNTITISQGGASAGFVNWIDVDFWAGAHCFVLCPHEEVNNRYLFHFVKSLERRLQECQYGAGIPALAKKTVEELMVPLPPLKIQESIAEILDCFTSLNSFLDIELEKRIAQYDFYRKKIFDGIDEYEEKKLEEVASIFDSLHKTPQYADDGYPMIRVQDVVMGVIDTEKALKVSAADYDVFTGKYEPQENDIVISRVGSFGRFGIVPNVKCCLGQNVSIIHPLINPKYLYYYISSEEIKRWIGERAKGAGHKSFSLADIKKIPIKVPTKNVQEQIVNLLNDFDLLCNSKRKGIPAEMEARQKQYEYYRDQLLTEWSLGPQRSWGERSEQ